MNLVMLDIDGTLTQSYEYDQEIFGLAIAEVIGCPPVNADLNGYLDKTSTGVSREAIRRLTGTNPTADQIDEVKRNVLWRLERMCQESPEMFSEVPGAARFLERLRGLAEAGIVIATGCWLNEALFKLHASGLSVAGIPMATSDDDGNRKRIMQIAAKRARAFYTCPEFERVVYLGDGPWDLQEAHTLGYRFIGIGPRIQALQETQDFLWHPDFLELEAVLTSIAATLRA
ncbi:MAG: HAD family hydrolase [Anaerolineales bacterium]|jgi:phosphoglycolate phosphatase-like HAD superfamily hydrolase